MKRAEARAKKKRITIWILVSMPFVLIAASLPHVCGGRVATPTVRLPRRDSLSSTHPYFDDEQAGKQKTTTKTTTIKQTNKKNNNKNKQRS